MKFEEFYKGLQEKIDMIAEGILTLGATPLYSVIIYIELTSVPLG